MVLSHSRTHTQADTHTHSSLSHNFSSNSLSSSGSCYSLSTPNTPPSWLAPIMYPLQHTLLQHAPLSDTITTATHIQNYTPTHAPLHTKAHNQLTQCHSLLAQPWLKWNETAVRQQRERPEDKNKLFGNLCVTNVKGWVWSKTLGRISCLLVSWNHIPFIDVTEPNSQLGTQ